MFGHIHEVFFNNNEKIDKKIIEYFEDNIFIRLSPNTINLVLWP